MNNETDWIPISESIFFQPKIDKRACEYIRKTLELDAFSIGYSEGKWAAAGTKGGKVVVVGPMSESEFSQIDKFNMICRLAAELGETQ